MNSTPTRPISRQQPLRRSKRTTISYSYKRKYTLQNTVSRNLTLSSTSQSNNTILELNSFIEKQQQQSERSTQLILQNFETDIWSNSHSTSANIPGPHRSSIANLLNQINTFNLQTRNSFTPNPYLNQTLQSIVDTPCATAHSDQQISSPNQINSINEQEMSQSQTSLAEILKMGEYARLNLPKNLNEISKSVEVWERIMEQVKAEPTAKLTILRTAIEKRSLKMVTDQLDADDTYEVVKNKLISEVGQSDLQFLLSPVKKDPIKAFEIIKSKCSQESTEDKIRHLREHIDKKTINKLILDCDSDEDVMRKLKKIMRNKHQSSKDKRKRKDESSSSDSDSSTESESSSSEDERQKTKEKHDKSKIKELEKQIAQLMKEKKDDKSAEVNNVSTTCHYHTRNGSSSFRCTGTDCNQFNPSFFNSKDNRSHFNEALMKANKQNRRANGQNQRNRQGYNQQPWPQQNHNQQPWPQQNYNQQFWPQQMQSMQQTPLQQQITPIQQTSSTSTAAPAEVLQQLKQLLNNTNFQ